MFKTLLSSYGRFVPFSIEVGLWGGEMHASEEVASIIENYLKERSPKLKLRLRGVLTIGTEICSSSPTGRPFSQSPQAIFSGRIGPLFNSFESTPEATRFLNELAERLGLTLGQKDVYVALDDHCWVFSEGQPSLSVKSF
jgi:hypothetical protein